MLWMLFLVSLFFISALLFVLSRALSDDAKGGGGLVLLMGFFILSFASWGITTHVERNWLLLATCLDQKGIQEKRAGSCKPNITLEFEDGWVSDVKYHYPKKTTEKEIK